MNNLLSFDNFKTLYVFDLDDTLVDSPSFEESSLKYLSEGLTTNDLLISVLGEIGAKKSDLKYENGRLFINDPNAEFEQTKNWIRKHKRLYLIAPDKYGYLDDSLPIRPNYEILNIYKSVKNKCVITARPESMRHKIEGIVKNLGIEYPNLGFHMCPNGKVNAGAWKGEKIVELVDRYKFDKAIFYDDNSKYIKAAKKVVFEKLPNFNFKAIKV